MRNKIIDGILVVLAISLGVGYALWVNGGPPYMMGG